MSLSWVGIRLVRRLRFESAWNEKHSSARPRAQLIQDKISTTRRFAFEEQDAPVIEAQQEMIDAAVTAVDPVILAIDVGPVRYKQILQKLIHAEQRQ